MSRSWRHVYLLALAFLVLFWQPGIDNNDEVAQSVAMTAFADGHLVVNGSLHPGYDPYVNNLFRHFSIPQEGQIRQWTANVPMMVVAMPLLFAMRFLAEGLGVMGAVGLVAGTVIGGAAAMELRYRGRSQAAWGGTLLGLLVFVMAWRREAGFQATPMLEMASQQLAGMAAVAAGGVLLWDLARRIWGREAAPIALAVFLLATPAFFWAGNLKYHGFAMAGIAWSLHALWRASRGSPWAWAEAGLATGIGFWNHGPTGLTMMAAFGVVGLIELVRQRTWHPLLGLPAFVVGILPDLALRWWYRNNLIRPRYFAGSTTGDSIAGGIRESATKQVEHTSYLDAPIEYLSTMWELLVWTPFLSLGTGMGVLAMAPWLALVFRKWRLHPMIIWSVVVAATTVIGGGRRLTEIGAGIDQRYVSSLWPILVLAAMPAILVLWRGQGPRLQGHARSSLADHEHGQSARAADPKHAQSALAAPDHRPTGPGVAESPGTDQEHRPSASADPELGHAGQESGPSASTGPEVAASRTGHELSHTPGTGRKRRPIATGPDGASHWRENDGPSGHDRISKHLRQFALWTGLTASWLTLIIAVAMLANGGSIIYRGSTYDVTIIHRVVGLPLFVAVAVAWPLRQRIPQRLWPWVATVPLVSAASMWIVVLLAGEMHSQSLSAPFVLWPLDLLVDFVRRLYGWG